MEEKQNNSTIILGFLITLVILFFVIAGIYYSKKNKIFEKITDPEEKNQKKFYSLELSAEDSENNKVYGVDFKLKKNNETIQEGTFKEQYITEYTKAENNTNYTLTLDSDEYYYTEKICQVNRDSHCEIKVKRIAEPNIKLVNYSNFYRIIIYLEKGIIKNPRVCFWENTDKIINLKPKTQKEKLFRVETPLRLDKSYSKCYFLKTKEELEEKYLEKIKERYEEIEKYNKEYETDYEIFEDIKIKPTDLQKINYSLEERFYEFNLNLVYDDIDYKYKEHDRLKIILIDLYDEGERKDIKKNDIEKIVKFK